MLRYSKLSDPQVLANLMVVCDKEHISCSDDGMEAIVFTAQGNNQEYVKYFAPTNKILLNIIGKHFI